MLMIFSQVNGMLMEWLFETIWMSEEEKKSKRGDKNYKLSNDFDEEK